ncbi:hypothetical protein HPP92_002458 [Vanilla planifolia]|uniref:Uncharacterized protein n=1 Tax=Vanilla planifolia TaxID=51239 RepID=A0A835VGB2_VANPL|nr:hypothetical protein HPP92_002458 [Vanilla planifolia]
MGPILVMKDYWERDNSWDDNNDQDYGHNIKVEKQYNLRFAITEEYSDKGKLHLRLLEDYF